VKKRVLLVEDEAGTRTALREFLERAGFLAAEAADGLAGLAQAESWHPHAILLDVRLPGLDGYEVCRRLTANPATKPIPVIVMTAFQNDALHRRAYEAGALACILKPFRLEALLAEAKAIRRDLRNSTGSPAAVRKAVEDLADLAAKAMEEAAQVFEGLTMTVLALHPDVTRAPQREKQRHDRRRAAGPESVEPDPVPVAEARELRESPGNPGDGVGGEFYRAAVPRQIRRPDTVLTPDAPEAMNPPERLTVLCIDDDPLVLHFYREFLDRHGYRVVTVEDGLLGIDLAHRERPDVILLDIMLRGLSGFDICRKLRADPAFRYVPIILITVWDHPSVVATGQHAGATLTLRKPADAETLLASLQGVRDEMSGAPPATMRLVDGGEPLP